MLRRVGRQLILAALAAILLVPAVAVAQPPTITATIDTTPIGSAMPRGFVGVSFETKALHVYTGRDPRAVNPVLVQLLRGLAPGQPPVIRIGGDSTDETWWPMRGAIPPGGITYALTKGWMRTTRALAQTLGAKLIVGVNLAADRPALAAAEAQAILQGIGRRYIEALEIGNEPDLYGIFAWYRDRRNHVVFARPRSYSLGGFIRDFSRWRAAIPRVPLVGPTFARLSWMGGLGRFLAAEPQVKIATLHRYPLRGCTTDPTDPSYASIPNLLADSSSAGLAEQVAPYANVAHSRGLQFRLDELNSAACKGRAGVSDTFAAALWVIDTLFNLQARGVDGVNVHSLPGAPYEPFTFKYSRGAWSAFVHPVYYGMMLFADAFPPGARRLPVNVPDGPVKVWATYDRTGHTRVVLINKDPTTDVSVNVALQGSGSAVIQRLTAPSVDSTSGVSFGGLSFGSSTTTGHLAGAPQTSTVSPVLGSYSVDLPPASVVLLTR